jgi:WD40 repeat protein
VRVTRPLSLLFVIVAWLTVGSALAQSVTAGKPIFSEALDATIETVTPPLAASRRLKIPFGAEVRGPLATSAAEQAGLRAGDVILSINDRPVLKAEDVVSILAGRTAEQEIRIIVNRDGQTITITFKRSAQVKVVDTRLREPQLLLETGGHLATIKGLAFTHTDGGAYLISAGDDKVVRIWDWREGTAVRVLHGQLEPGPEGRIYALALSPNDRWLAVAGYMKVPGIDVGHVIRLYDFRSGEIKALLRGHENAVLGLAFSPDSKTLIAGDGSNVAILWDLEARSIRHRLLGHRNHVYAVGFTADGERAVTGSDDATLRLWRVRDGSLLAELKGHNDRVRTVVASPTGGLIASGDESGQIHLWDDRSGAFKRALAKQTLSTRALTFSLDGALLLSGGWTQRGTEEQPANSYRVHVWDVATGKERVGYSGHDNNVRAAAISPDGRMVATGGGENNEIHLWYIASGERVTRPDGRPVVLAGVGRTVWAAAISQDGRRIGWGTDFAYRSHNDRGPITLQLTLPLGAQEGLGRPEAAVDMKTFLRAQAGSGASRLAVKPGGNYQERDGILVLSREGSPPIEIVRDASNGYGHSAYGFGPDGNTIISSGSSGHLIAYDGSGKVLASFVGHEDAVWAIAVSPDGRLLISASADQTVRLWSLAVLKDPDVGPRKQVDPVVSLFRANNGAWVMWTPQGYYASSPDGDNLVGWQINKGPDKPAEYYTARQLKQHFYRPDVVERALILADAARAVEELRKASSEGTTFNLRMLADRQPPRISISAPADGSQIADEFVDIVLHVAETPDPITGVQLFVNGARLTPPDMRGFIPHGNTSPRAIRVPLAQGENRVTVRAVNAVGMTERGLVFFGAKSGPLDRKGTLFVVAVGVDKYPQLPLICRGALGSCDLQYAGADALAFHDQIIKSVGPLHANVKSAILTNGVGSSGDNPTAAKIVDALDMLRQSDENDTVVVFLSGHGANDIVQGTKRYLFLSSDAAMMPSGGWRPSSVLSWAALEEGLGKARGRRLLFVDTCHAANAYSAQIVKNAYDDNIAVFSAVDRDTEAQERRDIGHGVFTYVVLRALNGEAARDKELRLFDFASFIDRGVRGLTNQGQQPEYNIQRAKNYVLARFN